MSSWRTRRFVFLSVKEFRQREDLSVKALCVLVVRTEIEHFVAEHGETARLQAHHGCSGLDRGFQVGEYFAEKLVGVIEEPIVVEGAPATQRRARHDDAESGILQYFSSGRSDAGMEIVIEGIGPENHFGLALVTRAAPLEPLFEGHRREFRQIALF